MPLRSVGVLLIEPVAIFEFGVAYEVFGLDRTGNGVPPFDFRVCSLTPGVPLTSKGTDPIQLVANHGLDALSDVDLVIVPASSARDYPEPVLEAIRATHARGATLLSVCSGVYALAAAGVLDGRQVATHWFNVDDLQEQFPALIVDADVLFVDEGDIITSAGTAAGIDACLHLVRRELGSAVASRIARRMVVPPQRDGGQRQYVEQPVPECTADSLAPLLSWVMERLDEPHSAASLARQAMMSERTFARRFAAETGSTPHKWLNSQRVLAARSLLEDSDLGVEQIATRVGFASAVVLREHFRRALGISPQDYRRRFTSSLAG